MGISLPRITYTFVILVLGTVLVLVTWQPVLPSGWIVQGMAKQIDPQSLSLEKPAVLRFELSGRGGGFYNLIMAKGKVTVTEGDTDQADLILAMKATDFNKLMLKMAAGKADESTFAKLVISNVLKIAGDMSVLELLTPTDKGAQ